ncbi:hypothetical protein [Sphingomonas quercus]|uniref:Uncharacterized protein n=1 Tax=Sphingomonas quercus TaxID=2842451 RepID=A0ABS6BJU8_9SPHN|nr:hypothetical protein [Sphingomonas quercus]MBU3078571.1 hypothetical protein [Sphingomonas quercus]
MIRLTVIALLFAGSGAIAGEVRLAQVPAGKMPAMQASAARGDCRGRVFVPAGKINTYGHAATMPRCETTTLAANGTPMATAGRD